MSRTGHKAYVTKAGFFALLMPLERALDQAAGGEWRSVAQNRMVWRERERERRPSYRTWMWHGRVADRTVLGGSKL